MEPKELNAINFYNEFIDCIKKGVDNNGDWVESKERYYDKFTNYINKELMPKKCFPKFSSDFSNEYYRFDVSSWEQLKSRIEDICKEVNMNPHLWDLRIAFEHENNPKDWFDEVIKLLYIDCPLKVVVGYNKYETRFINNKESDKSKLNALCLILSKLNRIKDLLSKNEFLIILGNCGSGFEEKQGTEYFGYKGYKLYIDGEMVKYIELL